MTIFMRLFVSFSREFARNFWITRSVLLSLVAMMVLCALLWTYVEDIAFGDALYMSLITAFTIGYGDIVPLTGLGKVISLVDGFTGVIFMGLSVAIATVTLKEILRENGKGNSK